MSEPTEPRPIGNIRPLERTTMYANRSDFEGCLHEIRGLSTTPPQEKKSKPNELLPQRLSALISLVRNYGTQQENVLSDIKTLSSSQQRGEKNHISAASPGEKKLLVIYTTIVRNMGTVVVTVETDQNPTENSPDGKITLNVSFEDDENDDYITHEKPMKDLSLKELGIVTHVVEEGTLRLRKDLARLATGLV